MGKWLGEHCWRQAAGLLPELNAGCTGSQKRDRGRTCRRGPGPVKGATLLAQQCSRMREDGIKGHRSHRHRYHEWDRLRPCPPFFFPLYILFVLLPRGPKTGSRTMSDLHRSERAGIAQQTALQWGRPSVLSGTAKCPIIIPCKGRPVGDEQVNRR